MFYDEISSPIGRLLLCGERGPLQGVYMQDGPRPFTLPTGSRREPGAFVAAREQLMEYFSGHRCSFELPMAPRGNVWELRVWQVLREIPYGETISYGELASRVCTASAARAVGLANGRNPISVIVPCHRVVGADGSLTGFGGGLERKHTLLDLEAGVLPLAAACSGPAFT